jgi:hypothetical protein
LVALLRDELSLTDTEIQLRAPAGVADTTRLTLFLYASIESPVLKNEGWRMASPTQLLAPPLTLDLYYLLTSHPRTTSDPTEDSLAAHSLLAAAMRVLHVNASLSGVRLRGELAGSDQELHVTLNPVTVEDMTRLWEVFPNESYRLSVSYCVTPVRIDTQGTQTTSRVTEHRSTISPFAIGRRSR